MCSTSLAKVVTKGQSALRLRKASVLYQDKMAIEKYADSIEGATPDPLEIGSYVLKVVRPPQQEVKLHLKYTGPYKVVTKLRPDFYEILDLRARSN